jgi:Right handed beta helix region
MNRDASIGAVVVLGLSCLAAARASEPSAGDYRSIQEAVDANPGLMVRVPPGDHVIARKIRLHTDGSGLYGPGRVVQTNPLEPIIEIERAAGVRVSGLTLLRPAGKTDTETEGVLAIACRDLDLLDLEVRDNRTRSAAVVLRDCDGARVRGCRVRNYMRITVDDRTGDNDWGYAFHCIDGTGIAVRGGRGALIEGNRIVEDHLLPTPENQRQFHLGVFVKKNPRKGALVSQKTWDEGAVSNWHQGSAVIVTDPEASDCTQVLGNYIENAAQGIDLHADHVVVAQNIVNNAFMGMKAMHGSRHVLITGNQFIKNDLWSIGLMPGVASHAAAPGVAGGRPVEANVDGGSIIANNIISDFGYGHAHWVWGDGHAPIRFDSGQKPDDPPLTDVVVQGNIVYDTGRDGVIVDGQPVVAPPRYRYAVSVSAQARGLHFSQNLLHPGTSGVANVELKP